MGRMTPSFRQMYQELLDKLNKNYVRLLRDFAHKDAFQSLLKDAWDREHAAMSNSELPLVLDAMNLTANVHNKSCIGELERKIEESKAKLSALEVRLEKLENLARTNSDDP